MLGDRWTLLIVREMLFGVTGFNELARSLPGISRSVLLQRLRQLERAGVIERSVGATGRTSGYALTPGGRELKGVVHTLGDWGAAWAFAEPDPRELDSDLLITFISRHVAEDRLPKSRIVVRFNLEAAKRRRYWLVMQPGDVSICLRDPGFETDVVVKTDADTLYRVYFGRTTLGQALASRKLELHGAPRIIRAFPRWFTWSSFAPTIRAAATPAAH